MLRLTETGFDMGFGARRAWHVRHIDKAPFGSPQKVREEFEEYLDACAQGLHLVIGFELADLIGAVAGCLWARPDLRENQWDLSPKGTVDLREAIDLFEGSWGLETPEVAEAAVRLLASILEEGARRGFEPRDLLGQAQLRSAISVNGRNHADL